MVSGWSPIGKFRTRFYMPLKAQNELGLYSLRKEALGQRLGRGEFGRG